ncbi:MAG TPA: HAMP domain-containing sensor histidine kinase [bacterium]|nr:HAMP domain-containing sensor histidine kinase [bacterium]
MAGRAGSSLSPGLLRNFVFLGLMALSIASLLYSGRLAARLEKESALFTDLFARFAASATLPASQDEEVQRIFRGFMDKLDFPIILTDRDGVPWTCKGVGISPDAIPYDVFTSTDPSNPPPGPVADLLKLAYEMDTKRTPIPMFRPDTGEIFGYIHYAESPLVAQLRWMPVIQIGIAGFLLLLAYLGLRSTRQSEKRSIWVGMAKETAHQLGTPISSLLGWVDLMEAETKPEDESSRAALREMRTDIARLDQVARRFERIGSQPKLDPHEVNPIITRVAEYLRRRLPTRARKVEIVEQLQNVPKVDTDPELLAWTIENLLRNAVDSILRGPRDGTIVVRTDRATPSGVRIVVEDNGPGIPEAIQNRIFEPGFSTKKRGWGLGLALARRIVEDYHRGHIRLLRSIPGVQTTFVLDLPEGSPRAKNLPPDRME